uniref:Uncharacterized protein n=1 Tax=Caenorhabditis japonica TaxID=281687 RepID=A0A8R1I811_CAEJA
MERFIGPRAMEPRNESGELLATLCESNRLWQMNSQFGKPSHRRWTHISSNKLHKHEIDHILANGKFVTDVSVVPSITTGSSVETCTSTPRSQDSSRSNRESPRNEYWTRLLPTRSLPLQQSSRALTSIWTTSTLSQCSRNSKIKQSLSQPITPPTDFRELLGSFSPNDVLWTDLLSMSGERLQQDVMAAPERRQRRRERQSQTLARNTNQWPKSHALEIRRRHRSGRQQPQGGKPNDSRIGRDVWKSRTPNEYDFLSGSAALTASPLIPGLLFADGTYRNQALFS